MSEAKEAVGHVIANRYDYLFVHFWVEVTESELLGTYLPGTGVIDKGLVGTKMDAQRKGESL